MDFVDYYNLLQLTPTADTNKIKTAYQQLAMMTHPDKNHADEQATSNLQKLNDAYSTLSNTEKRRVYDLEYERQRRSNQHYLFTTGRINTYTDDDTAPSAWFSERFCTEPLPLNPEPMRLFFEIREANNFIQQFNSCVSSTRTGVRRQNQTIERKEEAVRALEEEICTEESEMIRKYDYGGGPSNMERMREYPSVQAKTRRKVEMEADLKEEEEKLVSLESQLLDFSRRLSYWEKERDNLGAKFETAFESDPLSREQWPFYTVPRTRVKNTPDFTDVQPGTRGEFEEAVRRRQERKGKGSRETPPSFQGGSTTQSSNSALGN